MFSMTIVVNKYMNSELSSLPLKPIFPQKSAQINSSNYIFETFYYNLYSFKALFTFFFYSIKSFLSKFQLDQLEWTDQIIFYLKQELPLVESVTNSP